MMFVDRADAGEQIAKVLQGRIAHDALVTGLARGGVLVAVPIIKAFHLSLEIQVVKKISRFDNPELALGAVTHDGVTYVDWDFAKRMGVDAGYINKQIRFLSNLIKSERLRYHHVLPQQNFHNKAIVLVDDGAATGATVHAAVRWLRRQRVASIFLALPVAPPALIQSLKQEVDEIVVLYQAEDLQSVGEWYQHFEQVTDVEIQESVSRQLSDISKQKNFRMM